MRVLVPFKDVDGRPYSSEVMSGGIERFIKLLDQNFDFVDVHEIVGKDYTRTVLGDVAERSKDYDLVVCNYPNPKFNVELEQRTDAPIAWICHHTAKLAPDHKDVERRMRDFGGTLWMVSDHQRIKWGAKVRGLVPPAYADAVEVEQPDRYAITIGRSDKEPLMLHVLGIEEGFRTIVVTNGERSLWDGTMVNSPHSAVMAMLARASCYVSTWAGENFPITTLEALARGIPVAAISEDGSHASSQFFLRPFFGAVVDKRGAGTAIKSLMRSSDETRREIAHLTQQEFSRGRWLDSIHRFFEEATRK